MCAVSRSSVINKEKLPDQMNVQAYHNDDISFLSDARLNLFVWA
jgi:hypothetical protein